MKFLLPFAILVVIFTAVYGQTDPWKEYKKKYGKDYKESQDGGKEDARRKGIYLATDAQIKKFNSQTNNTYTQGHSQFSDMTAAEMTKFLGLKTPANKAQLFRSFPRNDMELDGLRATLPTSLDYRSNLCMPAVKNQGSCGSCWAFAAIAPLEFSNCKKNKTLVLLSEQQLVDCDPNNGGCSGGWYVSAWSYLQSVNGSAKQSLYNYTAKGATCKFNASMVGAKVASYGYVTSTATAMQNALQTYGPISVAITVVNTFYSYSSGVYNDKACDNLGVNHGVVVVGWGTLNKMNYWIVRNSWGPLWGSAGYVLMQRGVNKCSIEKYSAYVIAA